MTTGGGAVSGEISVNIRTEGGSGIPGTGGGTPRPPGGGGGPKDPQMSMLNADQKKQLEDAREKSKSLKEYQDFQKLTNKKEQNELLNELQRGRRQATMVAGAVTTGMLARNSKIMSTSMGALNTMFSAFIDVFLMPFIPLIIPVLKYIASLLPKWMEWTQKFADLFTKNPLEALKWAAEQFLKQIGDIGVQIGKLFGLSEEQVRGFYVKVGEWAKSAWDTIKTAWEEGVAYIKDVWERSGGNLWEAIKIIGTEAWAELLQVGKDMWETIEGYAQSSWTAFEERFPKTAAAIETAWVTSSNAVKGAWQAASDYISGVWEESGCSIMSSIGIIGREAMSSIGAAGRAGWKAFASWQPGVAASIEGAWCSAVTYITNAWKAGGGTIVGFFGEVAGDVGKKMIEGLSWLWSDEGGGMKQKFLQMWQWIRDNVLDGMGDFLENQTGTRFGIPKSGTRIDSETGAVSLGGTGMEMGPDAMWRLNPANADVWKGTGQQFKGAFTNLPFTQGGLFGGASDAEKQKERRTRIEEVFEESVFNKKNLDAVFNTFDQSGNYSLPQGVGRQTFIENAFMADPRFSGYLKSVELRKNNDRWHVEIQLKDNFAPPATQDGFTG